MNLMSWLRTRAHSRRPSRRRVKKIMVKAGTMIAHIVLGILLFFEGLSKRESCHNVVYVDEITHRTAVLYWRRGRSGDSKVVCAGIRQYVTAHGEREVDLDTVTQFVPGGVEKAFLSHLQPNFNYSCVVETELRQKTLPLLFSTQYAAPEPPEKPVVLYENGKQIDIQLFPTSTKYGPIDGYEVQFHIIDSHTGHNHGQLELPKELTRPKGLLASVEAAHSSRHPVPFYLSFRNGSLPSHITTSDRLVQEAVHSGTTYSVVTVAYTDNYDTEQELGQILFYTLSLPSKPFSLVFTSAELQSSGVSDTLVWLERHLLKWSMVVGVASSNIILIYFLLVGCCVARVARGRLRQPNKPLVAHIIHLEEQSSTINLKQDIPLLNSTMMDCRTATTSAIMQQTNNGPEHYSRSQEIEVDISVRADREEVTPNKEELTLQQAPGYQEKLPTRSTASVSLKPHDSRNHCFSSGEAGGKILDTGEEILDSGGKKLDSGEKILDSGEEIVDSGGSQPLVQDNNNTSRQSTGGDIYQTVEQSGSSLVFVPRGLSHGPLSQSRSTTADLAPDLEMDLYGISYSLDEPQDH